VLLQSQHSSWPALRTGLGGTIVDVFSQCLGLLGFGRTSNTAVAQADRA